MTAGAIAELTNAQPVGRGRWLACCPAHADASPSLSIREGQYGIVLLHCFAGCSLTAILEALGIAMRDLFTNSHANPKTLATTRRERAARELAEREKAQAERRANDIHRRVGLVVDALGARLARMPDCTKADTLTAVFHCACELRSEVESKLGTGGAVKTIGSTLELSPFGSLSDEHQEAANVSTEVEMLQFVGTGRISLPAINEQQEPWRWIPSVLTPNEGDSAEYLTQINTLDEFDALRGLHQRSMSTRRSENQRRQDPAANGVLRRIA